MPIQVSWCDADQRIIYWKFEGRWQWSEFDQAWSTSGEWMVSVPHPIDFILDFHASTLMPPDIASRIRQNTYSRLRKMQGHHLNVFLSDDVFLRLLLTTFSSVFLPGLLYAFASDTDEAQALIDRHRKNDHPEQ